MQVGGRMPRWETFHHVHIIGRVLKRMPASSALTQADSAPGLPGWHVINVHLPWLLQPLLQLTCCLRYVWSPEVITFKEACLHACCFVHVRCDQDV